MEMTLAVPTTLARAQPLASDKSRAVERCDKRFCDVPVMALQRRSELESVALAQEEIKRIFATTEAVSLAATNASLVAKRAGASSVGFAVVARELRFFAERLGRDMHELTSSIFVLIGMVASRMQRSRRMDRLCAACQGGSQAEQYLVETCSRSLEGLHSQQDCIRALSLSLRLAFARAEKQCLMGQAVERAAKIEAAYGCAFQPVLRQIAMEVEGTIEDLLLGVRTLGAMLATYSDKSA